MTFPSDMPDDYPWLPGAQRSLMLDQAELAARLGSIVTYDRRGQVNWMDQGQGGLSPWNVAGGGTGNGVAVIATNTYRGGYALQMTAGSTAGRNSELVHRFNPQELNRWGLEVAVYWPTEFSFFTLSLDYFTGAQRYSAQLYIDRGAEEIYIIDEVDGYTFLAALPNPVDAYGKYHLVKMVAHIKEKTYTRIMYDDLAFEPVDKLVVVQAAPDTPEARIVIDHFSRVGQNDIAVIGHVISTVGEP